MKKKLKEGSFYRVQNDGSSLNGKLVQVISVLSYYPEHCFAAIEGTSEYGYIPIASLREIDETYTIEEII